MKAKKIKTTKSVHNESVDYFFQLNNWR